MNVEVDRPGMVGILRENAFQALLDIGRPALRLLAARLPIVPGLGVHRRLGRQHRQFEVVRIFVRQRRRCIREGSVELRPFGSRIIRISRGDCFDEVLLLVACAGGKRLRLSKRGNGRRIRFRGHRHVDVRSEHQRLAEEAHGASRIEALRLAESPPGFRVVEIGGEPEALVEIALRLCALCADRIGQRPEVVPQRRLGILVGLHGLGGLRLSWNGGDPAVRGGKITLRRSSGGVRRKTTSPRRRSREQRWRRRRDRRMQSWSIPHVAGYHAISCEPPVPTDYERLDRSRTAGIIRPPKLIEANCCRISVMVMVVIVVESVIGRINDGNEEDKTVLVTNDHSGLPGRGLLGGGSSHLDL